MTRIRRTTYRCHRNTGNRTGISVGAGTVAALLPELLPASGAQNAGPVRNRAHRVGEKVVRQHATETATPPNGPVVVGLDGRYVRSRHPQQECHAG